MGCVTAGCVCVCVCGEGSSLKKMDRNLGLKIRWGEQEEDALKEAEMEEVMEK